MKDKKIIPIIIMVMLTILFIRLLPFLIIAGIIFYLVKKKKAIPQQETPKPIIEEPTIDPSVFQGCISECQTIVDEQRDIIKNVDIRQFNGRNDVTKEELAQYMFEQKYWDGAYERRIQMQEIIKHCNLTEEDIQWCEEELKHYTINGMTYTAMAVKDDEQKAIWEETNRIGRDNTYKALITMEQEHNEAYEFDKRFGITNLKGYAQFKDAIDKRHEENIKAIEDNLRTYDYNSWIKLRGYDNGYKENV